MADRNGLPLLAMGALVGLFVVMDFLPSVSSVKEESSPMNVNSKLMGPALKFLYCYS